MHAVDTGEVHRSPAAVVVIPWPDEADVRADLDLAPIPRLLVLDGDDVAPAIGAAGDWVRSTAHPEELAARLARLDGRPDAATATAPSSGPILDADGLLRVPDGRWVAVPPVEARLLAPLLDAAGHAVRRADLHRAAWGDDAPTSDRAVDGRVKLLRRRIAPLGLRIHTVRGVGYLLETAPAP